jgi:hypothetical protein
MTVYGQLVNPHANQTIWKVNNSGFCLSAVAGLYW